MPPGDALVHLDLHPMNVLLGPRGPVIIDWTNASRGAAAFDAGYTYVLMSTFEVSGLRDRVAQQVLVRTFAAYRGRRTGARAALRGLRAQVWPTRTPPRVSASPRSDSRRADAPGRG